MTTSNGPVLMLGGPLDGRVVSVSSWPCLAVEPPERPRSIIDEGPTSPSLSAARYDLHRLAFLGEWYDFGIVDDDLAAQVLKVEAAAFVICALAGSVHPTPPVDG